jgi:hypothetical protein
MLFSTHVSDTGPLEALRRKTPDPSEVSGLRSARTAICAPFTAGMLPKPQLGREALLACWEDEDSLDRFLADHPRTCIHRWLGNPHGAVSGCWCTAGNR